MSFKYLHNLQSKIISALLIFSVPMKADWLALNMTRGATDISNEVFELHMLIFWICVAIGVVVFGVMFYSMYAHTKKKNPVAATFHENHKVEIAWTIIPFLILIAMAIPASKTLVKIYDDEAGDLNIQVTGYQWKWQYNYLEDDVSFFSNLSTDMDEINNLVPKGENYLQEVDEMVVIPVGKKVRFLITANDVIHSWWMPAFAIKQDAIPGFVNTAWTKVDKPGIYRGKCTELCGKNHGFMPIVVKVVEQSEYDEWVSGKREAAMKMAELTTKDWTAEELVARGESVYAVNCVACHQTNGQGISGIFPALAGSDIVLNDKERNIEILMEGVQGAAMNSFSYLSEVELAAVITYTRQSWGNENNGDGEIVVPKDIVDYKKPKI
ncbi:cytochrome c oxidase subunit II [Gammaproteobacteria bacterium]|jgi:cytochrome c oxidase subunit 2|nr:cytochrome c oxidase subunit II [Gammaproteobacteria bacterium]MDC0405743.1 cytochrome c oxidase subunit II [Gammaproteobacteria bacterium]MDC0420846.1 cytochrome c oxidase subunit II [Gammaproteobacteria bacterium]MDC0536412.1 cytochrome c oxidase subunit II [Gammaproteobacteria bacterium]MDC1099839.1 cytochrome c oxidase subunit II [Gammaproteobacteria bacterium]|tara:strand:+ start:12368 stop:13513 length:1146 start_codon:yes stop_codon:yes gene_type:complete